MADKIVKLAELSRAVTGLWTKVKAFVGNAVKITSIKVNGVVQSIGSDKSVNISVPTKVSQLTNDTAFITKIVEDLVNYYTKGQIDGKISTLENLISLIPKFEIKVVQQLPTTGISKTTIYLVKQGGNEQNNLFVEYIRITDGGTDKWEKLGEIKVDLSEYLKKSDAAAIYITKQMVIDTYATKTSVTQLEGKVNGKRNANDYFFDHIDLLNHLEGGGDNGESVRVKVTDWNVAFVQDSAPGMEAVIDLKRGDVGTHTIAYLSDIPQLTYATPAEIDSIINSLE